MKSKLQTKIAFGRMVSRDRPVSIAPEQSDLDVLIFPHDGDSFRVRAERRGGEKRQAILRVSPTDLRTAVNICLQQWSDTAKTTGGLLSLNPDFARNSPTVEEMFRCLADSGHILYKTVLAEPAKKDKELGEILKWILPPRNGTPKPLKIHIETEHFDLPWNCLHPEVPRPIAARFGNVERLASAAGGFLGFQHSFDIDPFSGISDRAGSSAPFVVSLQVGNGINSRPAIRRLRQLLREYDDGQQLTVIERSTAQAFLDDLRTLKLKDSFVFFCCHCRFVPSQMGLGDGAHALELGSSASLVEAGFFESLDMQEQDRQKLFYRRPLVFINSCNSARSVGFRHRSLSREFTRHGACGIIGCEAAVPTEFGCHFAYEFIRGIIRSGTRSPMKPTSASRLLSTIRKRMLKATGSLGGLLYSSVNGLSASYSLHLRKVRTVFTLPPECGGTREADEPHHRW